nr:EOG090X00M6 [Macrothrix elegans]
MDLSAMDADSPVLWIRLDPDMSLLRAVEISQPDYQWQYQLRHERDVTAQIEAVRALERFATPATRLALTDIIENENCFYKVRCEAAFCLAKVANGMVSSWAGPPAMLMIFRKLFGSFSCQHIVRQNNFANFQHYFLQRVRFVDLHSKKVLRFLLDLFKYNDNSKNRLSDCWYRGALIEALGNTASPVVAIVQSASALTPESVTKETQQVLEEVARALNLEKLLPTYKFAVTVGCLRTIRKLQKCGQIPSKSDLFKSYAQYGQFHDVRVAALEALVEVVRDDSRTEDLEFVLDLIENDPEPRVRHELLLMLAKTPPFERGRGSRLDTIPVCDRLWKLMNVGLSHDAMLRNDVVDLYYCLYGKKKPLCLSGAMYQRVAEAPPTALESAEVIPGSLTHQDSFSQMDMEVSVQGSGFAEDGMSVASVEVVAVPKEVTVPLPSVTDTESTTVDVGGFSDNSQSLPGVVEGVAGKKMKRKKEKKKHKHKHKHKHHREKKEKEKSEKDRQKEDVAALSSESSGPPSPDMGLTF